MIAFDTDVLTLYLRGHGPTMSSVQTLPWGELALPIVVVEEVLRGRLDSIRKSQSKEKSEALINSYQRFMTSTQSCASFRILAYTERADTLFRGWRAVKMRVATQDLRIAAICVAHAAQLVTRNRKDYERLAGIDVLYWT